MRTLLILPILALALACDDASVFQPDQAAVVEAGETPSLAAATAKQMPFCTAVEWAGTVGESDTWVSGEVSHFCSGARWTHLDDLEGSAVHIGCATVNSVTGQGSGHGSLAMELTQAFDAPVTGGFEGRWLLQLDGTRRTGKWWGDGYGDFAGMMMRAEVDFDVLSPPYVICGFIFDPRGG